MNNLIGEKEVPEVDMTICGNCGSTNVEYDSEFGFHECGECGYVWGRAEDDPDNEEEALSPEDLAVWEEVREERINRN